MAAAAAALFVILIPSNFFFLLLLSFPFLPNLFLFPMRPYKDKARQAGRQVRRSRDIKG